jgi:hypothetical protein
VLGEYNGFLPWFKGVMGELIVNLSAKHLLDPKRYRLIKNVTLPR